MNQEDTKIKEKEVDLKSKLTIKQNLNKIGNVYQDDRFADLDRYFGIMKSQYRQFFGDSLTGKINLKSLILGQKLSLKEMNTIIDLHNQASDDEVYG